MNYTIEQIASASGVPLATARTWQYRGVIFSGEGRGPGNVVLFSLNRAVQFALIAELAHIGIAPDRAGMLVAGFTDLGNTPGDGLDAAGETREPGALYATGRTILIAHEGQDIGRVVCLRPDTSSELLFSIPGGPRAVIACLVDVNAVVRRVRAALGVVE